MIKLKTNYNFIRSSLIALKFENKRVSIGGKMRRQKRLEMRL